MTPPFGHLLRDLAAILPATPATLSNLRVIRPAHRGIPDHDSVAWLQRPLRARCLVPAEKCGRGLPRDRLPVAVCHRHADGAGDQGLDGDADPGIAKKSLFQ